MNVADELAVHAKEELDHALLLSNHIDYLGGMPSVTPKPVKTSEKAEEMLTFDLENEKDTIRHYRRRVKQADHLNEFAIAESLRGILVQEQDHLIALATALGIDAPDPGIAPRKTCSRPFLRGRPGPDQSTGRRLSADSRGGRAFRCPSRLGAGERGSRRWPFCGVYAGVVGVTAAVVTAAGQASGSELGQSLDLSP